MTLDPRALLADLVKLPSVNPMGRTDVPANLAYEGRVTDYLEGHLRALGVPYERQQVASGRDNLVARYVPPGAPPFSVIWEAHQDTVPVDGMVIDPFAARVDGDRLYGRGACDVKAGIATMLTAFARLVHEKPAGSAAVVLAFTVDEEHTFLGVQHLMASGVRADCAVVAEPTGLEVVRAHKGVVRWAIETPGVACHSSRPERGVNAIYRMGRLLTRIDEYATALRGRPADPLLGPPTLSVGMIQGGASPNTVPDYCRIEIDRRLIPGESPAAAVADVTAFLRAAPEIDFPFTVVEPKLACPPLPPDGSEELTARLGRAIDAVAGSHRVAAVPYGTDASTIAAAGVPAVVFGPGDIAQAHTKDEWIDLPEVERAVEVLYRFACGK
ncbi:M20 family metallopeptidase [Fimbriiglobus ruber]|uniref:Acetylornithine deacetylase n=1 Tax=Fimbriiglobus ruber TaxID=1908690 RepID=A0A225DJE3_9BACT|nr:M20 family metallopeptidase [Fimbriiglobus ruber]OWK41580.1 Acetylornithine deacetylase [Fimbriiglobus ruber]